jgi:2-phospho-L-lactate transferase
VKVVLLSGGVGGARFARGLVDVAEGANLTVVGNVGDDLEVLGMSVSPDLDSILYTLAGLHDEERGWGRAGETWEALGTVSALGGEDWFRLGDRDLGLHLVRTQALRAGEPLSAVTARLARSLAIEAAILPATDDRLRTWIDTPAGSFAFQEWFVARGHHDEVDGVRFEGEAHAAPGVLEAIGAAEAILIAPSNPYVSIWPILAVPEIRAALEAYGANNDDAVRGVDLVVFAVKADAAVSTARDLRQSIGSTPVLSVCAELDFGSGGVKPTTEATSIAKRIEDELDAPVVAGLHSLAAANLADAPPDEDALVCGDDAAAKALALDLASRLVSGSAVDCGPLASARALEGMTAVIVNVNKRYKAHAGLRISGLP